MEHELNRHGLPGLDLHAVAYPTDQLTINDLRRVFPMDFDCDWVTLPPLRPRFLATLMPVINNERDFASRVYAREIDFPRPSKADPLDLQDIGRMLQDDYVRLNLASGPAEAGELVRELSRQIRQLAAGRGARS